MVLFALLDLLRSGGIHVDGVQQSAAWQTIVKTRIIARNQQVVRVDRERLPPSAAAHTEAAVKILDEILTQVEVPL